MTAHNQNWQVQAKEEDENFINTCIEQIKDPIEDLMVMKKNGDISTICNVNMQLCKTKCQMLQHSSVQSLFGCPAHSVHLNCRGV